MKRRDVLRLGAALLGTQSGRAFAVPPAAPSQRALIIGNAAYRNVGRLVNPARDARLIATTLGRLGVECTCLTDCTNMQLTNAVDTFVRGLRLHPASLAWFYFSGHGAYVDGHNLMLGVDTKVSTPSALLAQAFNLDALQSMLAQVRPGAAVLVEDACRNNPFLLSTASATRGIRANPGLLPPEWGGTLTAYSTAPFTEAMDWPNRPNGPYATALSMALLERQQRPLETVFRVAADAVWRGTDHRQQPGYYSDLREEVWVQENRFVLAGGQPLALAKNPREDLTARDVAPRHYQVGVHAVSPLGQPKDWDHDITLLAEQASAIVGDHAATRRAIAQARRPTASPSEQALGARLLVSQASTRRELDAAQYLYLQAAQRGYVPAQVLLGEMAFDRHDDALAYTWLHLASRAGSARASVDLYNMLLAQAAQNGPPRSPDDVAQRIQQFQKVFPEMMQDLNMYLKNTGNGSYQFAIPNAGVGK